MLEMGETTHKNEEMLNKTTSGTGKSTLYGYLIKHKRYGGESIITSLQKKLMLRYGPKKIINQYIWTKYHLESSKSSEQNGKYI